MSLEARIVTELGAIPPADWVRLGHADNPFVSQGFLAALESSGSLSARAGWTPQHLALFDQGRLVALAPTYVKTNSHGEFVFDWNWADAYHRHGLPYYPKLLTAVPYSPVTGPRLLVAADHAAAGVLRERLVRLALDHCASHGLSSWHCNFSSAADDAALEGAGLLPRSDWQFHWFNRGYADFEDFLTRLKSRKRKSIRRERRQVREAGVRFRWLRGRELDEERLDFVHRCYLETFRAYGNLAALNRDFFTRLAAAPGDRLRVVLAEREGEAVAMSLFLLGGGRLYGRYWGCVEAIPGLHFEAAYYQGIEYCIAQGIEVFESGAQGEHKLSRGFEPVRTRSWHYLADERFRQAVAQHLRHEQDWGAQYRDRLGEFDPFRQEDR